MQFVRSGIDYGCRVTFRLLNLAAGQEYRFFELSRPTMALLMINRRVFPCRERGGRFNITPPKYDAPSERALLAYRGIRLRTTALYACVLILPQRPLPLR
jgi:hypothetical protein